MLTCSKTYRDIPFAHRQHRHAGHCAFLHGHNWTLRFTFACTEPDENGFVIDFGKLKYIKEWIQKNLDHACLFNQDDPEREALLSQHPDLFKPYILPDCSSEGLAHHLYEIINPMVQEATGGRVRVTIVEVEEDSKNAAMYSTGSLAE